MKILQCLLVSSILWLSTENSISQSSFDYTVPVSVTVQESPPKINLHWPLHPGATGYQVQRRNLGSASWVTLTSTLSGTDTLFEDAGISLNTAYEYAVNRFGTPADGVSYLASGIKVPETETRNKMLLLVDDYFADTLSAEIERLTNDLTGDGWKVIRTDISRMNSPASVRAQIQFLYNADPGHCSGLFLLGHIPVPYSGNLYPDGHTDHQGAWPADCYYAEMNGTWTDASVNNTAASRPENHNIPGDGKLDQSLIPTNLELECGRVDFFNLPSFAVSETELMRHYLNRNHQYRRKITTYPKRAIVDDNFGGFAGEAFGSNGWRLSSLLGPASILAADYFGNLDTSAFLWSYGCGGGSYTSCGGVGNTGNFAADTIQTAFTLLFGSYFGDWDAQNNFLRSSLASGALTAAWAGRPHWHFHSMALGDPIGKAAKLTQNNSSASQYVFNYGGKFIHTGLMGDPSLEQDIIAPPSGLQGFHSGINRVDLQWTASADTVLGYHLYKEDSLTGLYVRANGPLITDTFFVDSLIGIYSNRYLLRGLKLETAVTGSYYNLSGGIFDTVWVEVNRIEKWALKENNISVFPNPTKGLIEIKGMSSLKNIPFRVFDITGRVMMEGIAVHSEIQLESLSPGLYFLSAEGFTVKICRQ